MIHHGADRPDGQSVALHRAHVEQKYGKSGCARLRLLARRGAGKEQHEIGILGPRGPDFLAVDDVAVAVARRRGAQTKRIGAGGRLGDAERLQAEFAAGNAGKIALLLLGAAVPQHRPHRIHLGVTAGAVAARSLDFLHDRGGRRHGEAAAAVLFRNKRGEKAGLGQCRDEFFRIRTLAIQPPPVFAWEIRAQRPYRLADRCEVGGFVHDVTSARPWLMATTSRSTTRARKLTTGPSRHISVRMVSPGNTGAENRQANDLSRAGS